MRCAYAYAAMEDEKWLEEARKAPFDEVFPNREMDFTVLEKLEAADEANAAAPYLLGCMHYARYNGEKALEKWLESIRRKPDCGASLRGAGAFRKIRRQRGGAEADGNRFCADRHAENAL